MLDACETFEQGGVTSGHKGFAAATPDDDRQLVGRHSSSGVRLVWRRRHEQNRAFRLERDSIFGERKLFREERG